MPVRVTDSISTTDESDIYATHLASLGKGGHRTVSLFTDLDTIPAPRREAGMLVYVSENETTYQLSADALTWVEFVPDIGGIGVDSVQITADRKIQILDSEGNTVTTIGTIYDKIDRVLQVGKTGAPYSTVQSAVTASTFGNLISIAPGGYTESVTITQANTVLYGEGAVNDSYGSAVNGTLTCNAINRLRMKDLQWQGPVNITGGTGHKLLNCAFQSTFNLSNIVSWSEITDCSFTNTITISETNTGSIKLIRPSFQSNGTIVNLSTVPVYVVDCIRKPTIAFTGNVIIVGQYDEDEFYSPAIFAETVPEITDEKLVIVDTDGKFKSVVPSDFVADVTYTNATPTTAPVGGVPAGSTFNDSTIQQVFDMLFYPYQFPAFATFSISGLSDVEVGTTIASATRTATWTTSNSSNITANTVEIRDVTNNAVLGTGLTNDGSESILIPELVKTSNTSHQFAISATNTQSTVFTRTFTVNWRWAVYYGESALTSLDSVGINGLRVKTLSTNSSGTYVMNGGGYKYITYPTVFGLKTTFKDQSTNLDVAMDTVQTVSVTNANGIALNYYVHRTLNQLGGSVTIVVS